MRFWAGLGRWAGVALVVLAASGVQAQDASPWTRGDKTRTRLISAGGLEGDHYRVGVEIVLNAQALTYWRTPGEAGVPPLLKFDSSKNFGSAEIKYPAPGRFLEGGAVAFGYRERVIFPIDVKPLDPGKPMTLDIDFHFAVCENICIPAEARLKLDLRPDAKRTAEAAQIEAFAAKVPKPLEGAVTTRFNMWGVRDAKKPTWRVRFPAAAANSEVFAEGPEGWYFDTRPAGDALYDIILAEKPSGAVLPIDGVVLTITNGQEAYETTTRLEAPPARP